MAVTPVPRAAPDGERRTPAVEGPGDRGLEPRRRDVGRGPADGPSDHFGRLFDGDDRAEARGWLPGWAEDRSRVADRRLREATDPMDPANRRISILLPLVEEGEFVHEEIWGTGDGA